jgi:hypothetical protein
MGFERLGIVLGRLIAEPEKLQASADESAQAEWGGERPVPAEGGAREESRSPTRNEPVEGRARRVSPGLPGMGDLGDVEAGASAEAGVVSLRDGNSRKGAEPGSPASYRCGGHEPPGLPTIGKGQRRARNEGRRTSALCCPLAM